jgi:uncharacterized RDD family membrane protein YckC
MAVNGWLAVPGTGAVKLASVGQRFAARLIDTVLGLAVSTALIVPGMVAFGGSLHEVCDVECTDQPTGSGVAALLGSIAAALLVGLLYEWLLTGLRGQTLGKMALGIKVIRQDNGSAIGLGRAALRQVIPVLALVVGSALGLVVFLSVFFDDSDRNLTWYDKAAGDYVIAVR